MTRGQLVARALLKSASKGEAAGGALKRLAHGTMNALSSALQNNGDACPPCTIPCSNVWTLIETWVQYTPEFQLIVELISSPLALIVALWGMTSERTLQLMKSSHKQMVSVGDSVDLRTTDAR